jgi:uncharacterized protein
MDPNPRKHRMRTQAWPKDLVAVALSGFAMPQSPYHGLPHWARVRSHGVRLALHYGLSPAVPALFGLLHDCRRENESYDPQHGVRAAELVDELASKDRLRSLSQIEIRHLSRACEQHSDGLIDAPRIIQVCWDADRLDLGRVGITPDPRLLCTPAAREEACRAKAYRWSCGFALRDAGEFAGDANDYVLANLSRRSPRP